MADIIVLDDRRREREWKRSTLASLRTARETARRQQWEQWVDSLPVPLMIKLMEAWLEATAELTRYMQ